MKLLLLDTTIQWPVKRSRSLTGEYVKPVTTSSRNAAPLTTHETEKSALTEVPLSTVAIATHGFHSGTTRMTRDESEKSVMAENARTPTNYGVLVGKDTIALTPIEGHSTILPTQKRKRHKSRHNFGRYEGRKPTKP